MPANDDYSMLSDLAEKLGLDDSESENFITSSMRRLGHRASIAWSDNEEQGDKGGGDFFSKAREKRDVRGGRREQEGRGRASGNSGWQYDR